MAATMNREDALAHVNRGRPLAFLPKDGQPRRVTDRTGFPGSDEPGEYAPVYDPRGNLTRAGMRVVLAEGGSVSHQGRVIDSPRDLPPEEEFAEAEAAQPGGAVGDGQGAADIEAIVGRFVDDIITALQARRSQLLRGRDDQVIYGRAPSDEDMQEAVAEIERLRAENEHLRAENERLRAENERLRAENEALKAQPQPPPMPPAEEAPAAQPVEGEDEMGFRKRRR
jgi:hypothetical protein